MRQMQIRSGQAQAVSEPSAVRERVAYQCTHHFRAAVNYSTMAALVIACVAGCSGAPNTGVPTPDPVLATATPISPPTAPQPTQVPTSTPIAFADLNPAMIGMGEHGNVTCISYDGNPADLEGIVLSANFSQSGKVVEANVPAEVVDGNTCFENVDAKYAPGDPVEVVMYVKTPSGIALATQTAEMPGYQVVPFILPMFRRSEIGDAPFSAEPYHYFYYGDGKWMERGKDADYYATDICLSDRCQGGANAPGEGLAIYMPGTIRLIQGSIPDPIDTRRFTNWNIYFDVPSTGFIFFIGHVQPGPALQLFIKEEKIECGYPPSPNCEIQYDPNAVIAFIGPFDAFSGTPHAHMAVQRPNALTSPYYGYDVAADKGVCPDDMGPCEGVNNINMSKYVLDGWTR